MLKFNPVNYLSFTPNGHDTLQSSFIISNPSNNCSAPFKIKSTRPQLFTVRPHMGVILPLQQVQVSITTPYRSPPQFARQIAQEQKFRIEYSMLDRAPISISEALARITDENKQIHKFYIATPDGRDGESPDNRSAVSNHNIYRSARDAALSSSRSRQQLPGGERLQDLKNQIDRAEKERSEVIMGQPKARRINLQTAILIFLFMVIVGNLTGKLVFSHDQRPKKREKKKREYRYWGLQKWWVGEQPEQQQQQLPWWKFWN